MPDLKLALRHLARRKLFAASSVLLLALGIGLAGILAIIIRDVMLSPFPYRDSDRLVLVSQFFPSRNANEWLFTDYDVVALERAQLPAFVGFGALEFQPSNLRRGDTAERIASTAMSRSMLDLMGVPPQLGRFFLPEECEPGAPPVVLLSHAAWTNRFAADPHVLGQTLFLDEVAHTIIGVMPPRFRLWGADVWTPMRFDSAPSPTASRARSVLSILREGYTLDDARAQLQQHFDLLAPTLPASAAEYSSRQPQLHPMMPIVLRGLRQTLLLLASAVALLLVLTAVNFGSLTFLRIAALRQELAIRVALGASRLRIAGQLVGEIGLIALVAGALAVLLVQAGVPGFLSVTPSTFIPAEAVVRVDAPILGATFVSALALALASAAPPILLVLLRSEGSDLAQAGRVQRGSRQTRHLESTIVVAEVALAFAIVLCTATVALNFARKLDGDGGFARGAVSTLRILLPSDQRANLASRRAAIERAEAALAAAPGVTAASLAEHRPLIEIQMRRLLLPGRDPSAADGGVSAHFRAVSPGYLATTGMRLLHGRFLATADSDRTAPVAVVNETFARALDPRGDALGRTLLLPARDGADTAPAVITIVGITADTLQPETRPPGTKPEIFVPLAQADAVPSDLAVLVRAAGATLTPTPVIMAALRHSLSEGVSFHAPLDFESLRAQLLAQHRLGAFILSVLGVAALAIAALGLYSLLAYSLAQRTREMGIRQALGATPRGLVALFCVRGLRLSLAGLVVGAIVFRLLIPQLRAELIGGDAFDPTSVALSLGTLLLVASAASLVPGLRAAKTDPVVALRTE